MRNLHLILLQEFGIEVRCLLREWERLRLRSSDYKNHRIFSLRCLHKDLIPVSIKLKSTLDTPRARQIIRKAEKDLLQARIKAINNILVQVNRQIEDCRAKLASIILAERLGECQDFINKVSEFRFNKVRQRQINKLNHLVSKKEGNITIANAVNNLTNSVNRQAQAPHNPTPATAVLPPMEGSNSPPATGNLLPEGTGLPQANNQATAHLPPREGSNSPLVTGHLLPGGTGLPQSNSQVIGSHPTPAIAHLPPGEGSSSPPATVHPSLEGNSSPNNQASGSLPTLAIAHLPPREGSNALPGAIHLPSEDVSSSQASVLFPSGEENNSSQATSLPLHRESNSPPQSFRSTQAGQGNNPPRAGRQGNRHPPGKGLHSLPRRPAQPPGKATPPQHPPVGPTKVLQLKNPTLSGSLTFPTNP